MIPLEGRPINEVEVNNQNQAGRNNIIMDI